MNDKKELEVVTVTSRHISWQCPICYAYWDEEEGAEGSEVTCNDCNKSFTLE